MDGWFTRFLIYGALGWTLEVVFTGLWSIVRHRDRAATGKTYLWMHPIYGGTALLLERVHEVLAASLLAVRVAAYLGIIYLAEYVSGFLLRALLGRCPWDYSGRGLHLHGLIRLDYAPAWILVCLLFEPARAFAARLAGLP
jgi:uncharacterized membrane protein